jgi:hypothetical protein
MLWGRRVSDNGYCVNSTAIAHIIPAQSQPVYHTFDGPGNAPGQHVDLTNQAHEATAKTPDLYTGYPQARACLKS